MKELLLEIEKEIGYAIPENAVYTKSEKSLKVSVVNGNITVEYANIRDIARAALILKANGVESDYVIEEQMEFIDEVHKRGGEVLMSSHIRQFRPAERVLEMALEQQRRGADVVKIVAGADTQEEEIENLRICHLLKEELKVPFLFLSGGTHSYLHRTIGPALGVSMWLCFREYDETTYAGPPLLSNVLKIKQGLKL